MQCCAVEAGPTVLYQELQDVCVWLLGAAEIQLGRKAASECEELDRPVRVNCFTRLANIISFWLALH